MRIREGTVSLVLAAAATACGASWNECRIPDLPQYSATPGERVRSAGVPRLVDLSGVKPFRNYFAVTGVGAFADRFYVTYLDHEGYAGMGLRVTRGPDGAIHIQEQGDGFGRMEMAGPRRVRSVPPELAPLARDLDRELRKRCAAATDFIIDYVGSWREVQVLEFVAQDVRSGDHPPGRFGRATLHADADLQHIVGPAEATSGWGIIAVWDYAQWIDFHPPLALEGRILVGPFEAPSRELVLQALEAARRAVVGQPSTPLARIVAEQGDRLPPEGFARRVAVRISFAGGPVHLIRLDLRDAVFGPLAVGEAQWNMGHPIKARATLTPESVRSPSSELIEEDYRGTLTIRLEDDEGHAWERTFSAHGKIERQGTDVASLPGLEIPGGSSSSPENAARHGTFPPADPVRFVIDGSVYDEPREP